ncbi:hypothetical protein [Flavobacterium sp.]|jgi:hypothetical protein|uniref:hypothetical protein n=1 Tax=Flavobacterium sp. TaxID=239 RepID=UPI0037BEF0D8
MKKTMTTYDIAHELIDDENANWSRAGAFALAEYLEELEDGTGEEMEFDHVAIRCDFSEYASLQEWAEDYYGTGSKDGWRWVLDITEDMDDDEIDDLIRAHIQNDGQLIEFDGGIIVSSF